MVIPITLRKGDLPRAEGRTKAHFYPYTYSRRCLGVLRKKKNISWILDRRKEKPLLSTTKRREELCSSRRPFVNFKEGTQSFSHGNLSNVEKRKRFQEGSIEGNYGQ